MNRHILTRALVALLLGSATLLVLSEAGNRVRGVEISHRVIRGTITLPDGGAAIPFGVNDGTLLTAERARRFMYGFAPAFLPEGDGGGPFVAFLPLEITEDSNGQHARQLTSGEPERLRLGSPHEVVTPQGSFKMRVSEVIEGDPARNAGQAELRDLGDELGRSGQGTCCVTCGEWTLCSTQFLTHWCGECQVTDIRSSPDGVP